MGLFVAKSATPEGSARRNTMLPASQAAPRVCPIGKVRYLDTCTGSIGIIATYYGTEYLDLCGSILQ